MRPRRAGSESRIEIQLESRVQVQVVPFHPKNVDSVVTFLMHFPERVFIQEIVRDH
jgi:hypothetical protein